MSISADEIRDLRKHLGLTQTDLAERLNITRDAVANWENERNSPSGPSELLLRQLLGLVEAKETAKP